jgi:uncharacterized RDD family membrane protein YckC
VKFDLKPRTFTPPHATRLEAMAGAPLGSFRARLGAWVLDILAVIGLLVGVTALRAAAGSGPFAAPEKDGGLHVELFHDPFGLALIVLYFGLVPRLWNGRTPGKRAFRLRIVSLSHERLTLWQCVERALGYGFSSLEGGFGFIQYFLHPNRQTLHDRIAETVVLAERPRSNFPRPERKKKSKKNVISK